MYAWANIEATMAKTSATSHSLLRLKITMRNPVDERHEIPRSPMADKH